MKTRFCLIIIFIMLIPLNGILFAMNTVQVDATSEPIQYGTTCGLTGKITLTFDHNTIFVGGDQITIVLDNLVTLCRSVDLEIGIFRDTNDIHAGNITSSYLLPPYGSSDSPISGDGTLSSANGGIIFKLFGYQGSSKITINIMSDTNGDGTLESDPSAFIQFIGATPLGRLGLRILDGSFFSPSTGQAGVFSPINGVYNKNNATASQNALYIDISANNPANSAINAILDSAGDKYVWIPFNPQIAHVVSIPIPPPIISARLEPFVIKTGETFDLIVQVNPDVVAITLQVGTVLYKGSKVETLVLFDDGTHGDQIAGDKIFTINDIYFDFINNSVFDGTPLIRTNWKIKNAAIIYSDSSTGTFELDYYISTRLIREEDYSAPTFTSIGPDIQKTNYLLNLVINADPPNYNFDSAQVVQRYYDILPDDRDFIIIEDTFNRITPGIAGSYSRVSNKDTGFNISEFDYSSTYGSSGKLQGRIRTYDAISSGLLNHEFLHRWAAYLDDIANTHWVAILRPSSGFGTYWGAYNEFSHITGRQYRATIHYPAAYIYSDFELYLMGLLLPQDVSWPVMYLVNPTLIATSYNQIPNYRDFDADGIGELSLEQMVSAYGDRIPAAGDAQNQFNIGTIIVSSRLLTEVELCFYDMFIKEYGKQSSSWPNFCPFATATGGRAQLTTSLPETLKNKNIFLPAILLLLEE